MKKIMIKLDNSLLALVGNEYGQEIFKEYQEEIEKNKEVTLEFPKSIELVVPSFIHGFTKTIKDRYNDGTIVITGGSENCVDFFFKEEINK